MTNLFPVYFDLETAQSRGWKQGGLLIRNDCCGNINRRREARLHLHPLAGIVEDILNANVRILDVQVDFESLGHHLHLIHPNGLKGRGRSYSGVVASSVGEEASGSEAEDGKKSR